MGNNRGKARNNPKGNRKGYGKTKTFQGNARGIDKPQFPKSEGDNAFEWYNRYPALIEAAARIPFYRRPGMNLDVLEGSSTLGKQTMIIPGVMALRWAPSIGYAGQLTDPVNIAAYELYAKVRAAYSGALSADAPDIMIYILAMDSLFSYISFLKRVYRILNTYTPENYETPYTLLSAMGISEAEANKLMADKPKFLGFINDLIYKCNRYNVPAVFDYINRHVWMSENIYTDAPTPSAQMYVFVPKYFLEFALDESSAGSLKYVSNPTFNTGSLDDPATSLYNFGLELLNALAAYDEAYTISGYLQRAFEGAPMFRMETVVAGDVFQAVYSQEVLMQIENSYAIDVNLGSTTITQNSNNALISQIPVTNVAASGDKKIKISDVAPLINLHGVEPSPQNVVEATRLCNNYRVVDTKYYLDCGSEILINYDMHRGNYNTVFTSVMTVDMPSGDTAVSFGPSIFSFLANVAHYDWHPIVRLVVTRSEYTAGKPANTSAVVTSLVGDLQNATNPSANDIRDITRVCLLSEFNTYSL